jgi:hypothetical protein
LPMNWEDLLARVRDWMTLRFVLNTDRDWMVWTFIFGVAAHLEHLAVAVLWVDDGKTAPFNEYKPKMTLGQAALTIEQRTLLDSVTRATLKDVAVLRNTVGHRGATEGVPFQVGDPTRGEYKSQHVFTDPKGLDNLMVDMDAATVAMVSWLREHGLASGG